MSVSNAPFFEQQSWPHTGVTCMLGKKNLCSSNLKFKILFNIFAGCHSHFISNVPHYTPVLELTK